MCGCGCVSMRKREREREIVCERERDAKIIIVHYDKPKAGRDLSCGTQMAGHTSISGVNPLKLGTLYFPLSVCFNGLLYSK